MNTVIKDLKQSFWQIVVSAIVATVLTVASYEVALYNQWITTVGWLEAFSVWTSYSCTYLCVVQSRTNYLVGAVSVAALSVLFYQQNLGSSMALNIYLFPTLLYGWFRWGRDETTRPVTKVKLWWWPVYILATYLVWRAMIPVAVYISDALGMHSDMAAFDLAILGLSILAQFLLDQKKVENWGVWAVVNVLCIYTYWYTPGLQVLAIQYVFFLANTVYGGVKWYASSKQSAAVVQPVAA